MNESLLRLDAIVQMSATSATISAQPATPADGAVYILPAGKSGAAWGAMGSQALAYFRDGAWEAITPRKGWIAYVRDSNQLHVYDGAAWTQSAARAGLGLGTAETRNTRASGTTVPLLDGVSTWGALQTLAFYLSCGAPALGAHIFVYNNAAATLGFGNDMNGSSYELTIFAGGTVGSFGRISFGRRRADTGAYVEHVMFDCANGNFVTKTVRPSVANSFALRASGARWSTVYAATGSINTSDASAPPRSAHARLRLQPYRVRPSRPDGATPPAHHQPRAGVTRHVKLPPWRHEELPPSLMLEACSRD